MKKSKEDWKIKGRDGKPENGDEIITWNYSDSPEIRDWTYEDGKLSPVCKYVWDDTEPGDGEMVYYDMVESEMEEEMGHPTFEEELKNFPNWDYEHNVYKVTSSLEEYMNYDFNEKFAKCKFYSYYASYFVNDDGSGMNDAEIQDCIAFENALKAYLNCDSAWVVDVLDDADFGYVEVPNGFRINGYKGVRFYPGDVCTYVVQMEGRHDDEDSERPYDPSVDEAHLIIPHSANEDK